MTYDTDNKSSWFLIHTHVKQEERTTSNLRAWNVETLSPLVRDWRYNHFTGERTSIIKPLFARYVFARFDLFRSFHKIRYARGVQDIVGFGDGPIEIDQEVIDLIRSRMDKDGLVKMGNEFKPGDKVLIKDGALKDFTGVFEREIKDSDRVVLLLNTVSYQARVQIERNHLTKFSEAACLA